MHHSAHANHARHDLALIAGHAAGDLSNPETAAAADLLSSCNDCAQVHRDLVAIATATRALPHTARAPRDFRLTAEQAERLRRGSWLRTLLRPFASARSTTRPIAATFTSVGIAGVLVAVLLPALLGGVTGLGGAASGPGARDTTLEGAPAATSAPALAPGAAGAPSDAGQYNAQATQLAILANGGSTSSEGDVTEQDSQPGGDKRLADSGAPNPLLLGSLGLLGIGLALFGLRLAARRIR